MVTTLYMLALYKQWTHPGEGGKIYLQNICVVPDYHLFHSLNNAM